MLRGFSHSLLMWPSSPQFRQVLLPPVGQFLEKWPTTSGQWLLKKAGVIAHPHCTCDIQHPLRNEALYIRPQYGQIAYLSSDSMLFRVHMTALTCSYGRQIDRYELQCSHERGDQPPHS